MVQWIKIEMYVGSRLAFFFFPVSEVGGNVGANPPINMRMQCNISFAGVLDNAYFDKKRRYCN